MGQFKDKGDAALALAEECAEVIQVINKLYRFEGDWHEIPEGQTKTRWQMLQAEMADVFYQWYRLKDQVDCIISHNPCGESLENDVMHLGESECAYGTLHGPNDECDCARYEPDDEPMYEMTEEEKDFERMRMLDEMYGDDLNHEMKLSAEYSEPEYDGAGFTKQDRYNHNARSTNPQYVIASTSFDREETSVFEADENGTIKNSGEYGIIAKRLGHIGWDSVEIALRETFPSIYYEPIKDFGLYKNLHQILFKRYDPEFPRPQEN